ncbi:MAG: T9SS type A sorting domain-containing protein [Aquaticitalea sp.]
MKKITLLLVAFAITSLMTGQTTLSHSTSQVPVNGTVACANAASGFTLQNSFWRTYTPSNFGFTGDFRVSGAEFGWSFADNGGATPSVNVTVNIYTTTGTFPTGTRTLVGTQMVTVGTAQHLTVVPVTFTSTIDVPATSEIIVEVNVPTGETAIFDARVAQNAQPENGPSYLSSTGCGNIPPTEIATLGTFPDSHIIVNLVGDNALSIGDNALSSLVQVYPNPANNFLNVRVSASIEVTNTVLYDMLGKMTTVKLENGQLNISDLKSGIYMLKVNTSAGSITKKLVKK